MSHTITAGATSQSTYVTIRNASTGAKKTGLVAASFNNGTGSTASYFRSQGLATDITLTDLAAADSAYSSGGFKEVSATKAPGIYRVDLPNAMIAAGVPLAALVLVPASTVDAQQVEKEIQLTVADWQVQAALKKNTALSGFTFVMTDSTTHAPATGLTVTATRSLDGAAFGACANAVSEISNGAYKINLAAGDLNGNVVTLRFTAAGADDLEITLVTQP